MQVPHNAFVLVADGRKALFFRNEGDADYPNLRVEHAEEKVNPADRDQKTDAAGSASSTQMGTMEEVDFHQQEEDRFAADTADMLKRRALANDFEALIIVAPPKTLGELRKHYHKEVSSRLAGELAKDLTGHPVPEIEKALGAA
ncbi:MULTISPECIES: host attachment family protein [Sphingomonas]|uniref:Host attachment family protein n=1 Tax=Sphingomonas kyungheensis TaxID=1069987 RepID=A0ABU8H339_9SPHN|nr:host attachment family protein [Sphingomonas sp. RIT328]EZP48957.1 Required for attachment to host cells family protein [Sphingomonas sp. RIT328]